MDDLFTFGVPILRMLDFEKEREWSLYLKMRRAQMESLLAEAGRSKDNLSQKARAERQRVHWRKYR